MGKAMMKEEIELSEGWKLFSASSLPFGDPSAASSFDKIGWILEQNWW